MTFTLISSEISTLKGQIVVPLRLFKRSTGSLSVKFEHHPLAPWTNPITTLLEFSIRMFKKPAVFSAPLAIIPDDLKNPVTISVKYLNMVLLEGQGDDDELSRVHVIKFEVRIPSNFEDIGIVGIGEARRKFLLKAELVIKDPSDGWIKPLARGEEEILITVSRTGSRVVIDGNSPYYLSADLGGD